MLERRLKHLHLATEGQGCTADVHPHAICSEVEAVVQEVQLHLQIPFTQLLGCE